MRFRSNQNEAKWKQAVSEHEQILAALEKRDAVGLRALLVEHLVRKRNAVVELMRAGELRERPVELSPQPP